MILELLVTSLVLFIAAVASVGLILLLAIAIVSTIMKVSDWSDRFGCWVSYVALLIVLYLACVMFSLADYIGDK